MPDLLYSTIAEWQEEKQWGNVLDAGTGEQSLKWLFETKTKSITAITGDPNRQRALCERFQPQIRRRIKILTGNWLNHELLSGVSLIGDSRLSSWGH